MTSEANPKGAGAGELEGRQRNGLLLLTLTAFIVLLPFVREGGVGEFVVRVGFTAVVLGGIYTASEKRGVLIFAAVMAVPVLLLDWGSVLRKDEEVLILRAGISAAFVFFTASIQMVHLSHKRQVSADTILGGINIYLLLIVAFMFLHAMLEVADPGAYRIGEQSLREYLADPSVDDTLATSTLMYFSITTFTTLGYGDIVPMSGAARMVSGAEAIIGQLYVAIVVARLVAMEIGQRMADRR